MQNYFKVKAWIAASQKALLATTNLQAWIAASQKALTANDEPPVILPNNPLKSS